MKTKHLQLEAIYDPKVGPMKLVQHLQLDQMFDPSIEFKDGRWNYTSARHVRKAK